jgi:hypothetical protein
MPSDVDLVDLLVIAGNPACLGALQAGAEKVGVYPTVNLR